MKNRLRCPNCGSLKLRTQVLVKKTISINEDGECEFGKKILDEETFAMAGDRLFCDNCFKLLKYSDGVLIKQYNY